MIQKPIRRSSWWQRLWSRILPQSESSPSAEHDPGPDAKAASNPGTKPPEGRSPSLPETDSAVPSPDSPRAARLAAAALVAGKQDLADIEDRARDLLSAGEPPSDKIVFCILQIDGEGLLTIEGGKTPALVVFSPPVRAFHYGKLSADLQERQLTPSPFALEDWPRLADSCRAAGLGAVALNPSPRGAVARIYSLESAGQKEGLRDIWVTDTATQGVLFERRLQEAEKAHGAGDRQACLRICEEIVQHIDDLRPEVYVLLGQSAFADGDTSMLSYAYERLREFDEEWREQLCRTTSEQAAGNSGLRADPTPGS